MRFTGRSRQPPADVINAALSYGYAIVLGEAVSALCAAGLDPAIGLLHAEQDRRPSLALDLMEEFRPLIVDQVVIAAARRGELRPEHGRREETLHGVLLTKAGREILVGGYEHRMLQHTRPKLRRRRWVNPLRCRGFMVSGRGCSVYWRLSGMGAPRSSNACCWVAVGRLSWSKVAVPAWMVLRVRVARWASSPW
jgi:hypothetical protein